MDYNEIKTLAYAYADRSDDKTLNRFDDFLRIVEAKLNRRLKTLDNGKRTTYNVNTTDTGNHSEFLIYRENWESWFELPADFGGVNTLSWYIETDPYDSPEWATDVNSFNFLQLTSRDVMQSMYYRNMLDGGVKKGGEQVIYYAIESSTGGWPNRTEFNTPIDREWGERRRWIVMSQVPNDGYIMLDYYQRIPELSATTNRTENWCSLEYPDAYVFGVRAEIAAMCKNKESRDDWLNRLELVIEEMIAHDKDKRWSNNGPIVVRAMK